MRRPLRLLLVVLTLASAYLAAGASAATRVVHDPARKHVTRTRGLARKVVAFARHQVGVYYSYGGSSRSTGFDCSGLVYAAYRSVGREIPRSSWDQRRVGRAIGFKQLRPGDLLFTEGGGHVVLVASSTKAISAPHTGARVSYMPLRSLRAQFAGARRLLNS
jgi:cell wall-associated NlpC family hydrolase